MYHALVQGRPTAFNIGGALTLKSFKKLVDWVNFRIFWMYVHRTRCSLMFGTLVRYRGDWRIFWLWGTHCIQDLWKLILVAKSCIKCLSPFSQKNTASSCIKCSFPLTPKKHCIIFQCKKTETGPRRYVYIEYWRAQMSNMFLFMKVLKRFLTKWRKSMPVLNVIHK